MRRVNGTPVRECEGARALARVLTQLLVVWRRPNAFTPGRLVSAVGVLVLTELRLAICHDLLLCGRALLHARTGLGHRFGRRCDRNHHTE